MAILTLEGVLTFDGLAIPARLALDIDRAQLARLLGEFNATAQGGQGAKSKSVLAPSRPGVKAPHEITLADLEGKTSKEKWALIDRRFPWLFGDEPDLARPPESRADFAKLGAGSDQLDSDWDIIEANLAELVTDDGQLVRGYQSRIAELLGGSNAGHFREARVLPAAARLKAWIEEKFIGTDSACVQSDGGASATSSPDDEGETGDEAGDVGRVA